MGSPDASLSGSVGWPIISIIILEEGKRDAEQFTEYLLQDCVQDPRYLGMRSHREKDVTSVFPVDSPESRIPLDTEKMTKLQRLEWLAMTQAYLQLILR